MACGDAAPGLPGTTGTADDGGADDGGGPGGSSGGSSGDSGGGSEGADTGAVPECTMDAAPASGFRPVQRLNNIEYRKTLDDVLRSYCEPGAYCPILIHPVEANEIVERFPADTLTEGFNNMAASLEMDSGRALNYLTAAEIFAEAATQPGSLIITCDPVALGTLPCAEQVIRRFADVAFRRPVDSIDPEFVSRLAARVEETVDLGYAFNEGIQLAVEAMLISPYFLYRIELDPEIDGDPRPTDGYELASRLSYFLWGTMPDEELFQHAADDTLLEDDVLLAQIDRMIAHPKGAGFAETFVAHWLEINSVKQSWGDRGALWRETLDFATNVLTQEEPIHTLIDADYTFLNDRSAAYYGLDASGLGEDPESVSVANEASRFGILTHGTVLLAHGAEALFAPIARGRWVLDNILCTPLPSPPPGVDNTVVQESGESMRERLAVHASDPACAACHAAMDPIGLAFEDYDIRGQLQTVDAYGYPIDTAGVLPDGSRFENLHDLMEIIRDGGQFRTCVTEKLVTFSLGRPLSSDDQCLLEDLEHRLGEPGSDSLAELVRQVVLSPTFRTRITHPSDG